MWSMTGQASQRNLAVPQTFLHGFRGTDFLACWNMHLAGTLCSPDVLNALEGFGEVSSIREIPLAGLAHPATSLAATPRVRRLIEMSTGALKGVDEDRKSQERAILDLERAFEAGRRQVAVAAASRLSSIFLAENSPRGREMILGIKGHESFVLEVSVVTARRLSRHDSSWFCWASVDDAEAISAYWRGEPASSTPAWEWLCEGAIGCADEESVALLREHVTLTAPPDFRDLMRALSH